MSMSPFGGAIEKVVALPFPMTSPPCTSEIPISPDAPSWLAQNEREDDEDATQQAALEEMAFQDLRRWFDDEENEP